MGEAQGLWVAGTDTGVGKTIVSCALVRLLREQGVDCVGFKPMASGSESGRWGDVEALREAGGNREPIERICPLRFHAPLAPTMAGVREGIKPDLNLVKGAMAELTTRYSAIVAEGIGGLMVPLTDKTLLLDFMMEIQFPVLLVTRASLGTINHTLLSINQLERSKLEIAGIVMSVTEPLEDDLVAETKAEIERYTKHKISAVLKYCGNDCDEVTGAPNTAMAARATAGLAGQLNVRKLLQIP